MIQLTISPKGPDKIPHIKTHRELFGSGLKEAKDFVEEWWYGGCGGPSSAFEKQNCTIHVESPAALIRALTQTGLLEYFDIIQCRVALEPKWIVQESLPFNRS